MCAFFSKTESYDFEKIFKDPYNNLCDIPDNEDVEEFSRYRYHAMYAVIDYEWVEPLAEWIKRTIAVGEWGCLEIMAGRGWLARALREKGVSVDASDNGSDYQHRIDLGYPSNITAAVYDVEDKDAESINEEINGFKQDNPQLRFIVLICYPSDMDNDCFDFVTSIPKDSLIVYIGDDEFINTGTEDFGKAVTWLHNNKNHPEAFRLQGFPLDAHIEGVGNDKKEENTETVSILLGVPK